MRVLLVANYALDGQVSLRRFARTIGDGVRAAGDEVRVLAPEPVLGALAAGGGEVTKWLGYVDKFALFPRTLARSARQADVVHVLDQSNAPYLGALGRARSLVTCHDVIAISSALGMIPEHRTRCTGRVLQRWILRWMRRARRVACSSEATRRALIALAPELEVEGRTCVIPDALNEAFRPLAPEERAVRLAGLRLPSRFLLHVGGWQFYKNRAGVLAIFAALARRPGWDAGLVLAGKPLEPALAARAQAPDLAGRVHPVTSPPDEVLAALYGSAAALLFPSLAEGFGIPIAEAQACGCPVITSDRAPMCETAGGAALLVPPDRPEEAAERIAGALDRLPGLREAGFANAKRFATSNIIESYRALYREVVA